MATNTMKASEFLKQESEQWRKPVVKSYDDKREEGYTNSLLGRPTQQSGYPTTSDVYEDDQNAKRLRFKNYAGMSQNDELFQLIGVNRKDNMDYTAYSKWYKANGNKHATGYEDVGQAQLEKEQALYAYEHRDPDTTFEQWAWDTYSDQILKENGYHLDDANWWQARANNGEFGNPLDDAAFVQKMQEKVNYRVNMLGLDKLKDMPNQWEMLLEETEGNDVATAQRLEDARNVYNERLDAFSDQLGSIQKAKSLYKARMLEGFDPIIYDAAGKARFFMDTDGSIVTLTEDKKLAKQKGYGLASYHEDGKLDQVQVGDGVGYGSDFLEGVLFGLGNTVADLVSLIPLGVGLAYDAIDWAMPGENTSKVAESMIWFEGLKTDFNMQNDDVYDADGDGDAMWSEVGAAVGGVAGQVVLALATGTLGNQASAASKTAAGAGKAVTSVALDGVSKVASGVGRLTNFSNGVVKAGASLWGSSTKSALMLSAKSSVQNYAQLKAKQPISGWSNEDIMLNTAMNFGVNMAVSTALREVGSEGNNAYTRWKPILDKARGKATPAFTKAVANTSFGQYLTSSAFKYTLVGNGADFFENVATMASDSFYLREKASENFLGGIPDVFTKEMGAMLTNPASMTAAIASAGMQTYQGLDYGVSDMVGRVNEIYSDVVTDMDTQIEAKRKAATTPAQFTELQEMVAMKNMLLQDMKPQEGEDAAAAIVRSLDNFNKQWGGEQNFITRIVDKHAQVSAKAKVAQRLQFAKDMYYSSYADHEAKVKFAFNDFSTFQKKALEGPNIINRLSKVSKSFKEMDNLVRTTEAGTRFNDQMNIVTRMDEVINNESKMKTPDMKDSEFFSVHNVATLQKNNPEEFKRLMEAHGVLPEGIEALTGSQFLFTSRISGTDGETNEVEKMRQAALSFYADEEADYILRLQAEFPDQTFYPTLSRLGKNNGNDALFVLNTPLDGVNLLKTSTNLTAYLKATHALVHGTMVNNEFTEDPRVPLQAIAQVMEKPQTNESYSDLVYKMWKQGLLSTQDALKINENFGGKKDKLTFDNELGNTVKFMDAYNKAMNSGKPAAITKVVDTYSKDARLQEILEKGRIVTPRDMEALKKLAFREPGKRIENLQKKLRASAKLSSQLSDAEFDEALDTVLSTLMDGKVTKDTMLKDLDVLGPEEALKKHGMLEQATHASSLAEEDRIEYARTEILNSLTAEQKAFQAVQERRKAVKESGLTTKSRQADENIVYVNLNELTSEFRNAVRERALTDSVFAQNLEDMGEVSPDKLVSYLNLPDMYVYQEEYWNMLMAANKDNGLIQFNLANQDDRDALDTMLHRLGYKQTAEAIEQGESVTGLYHRGDEYEVFEFKNKGVTLNPKNEVRSQSRTQHRASEGVALIQAAGSLLYVDDDTLIDVNEIPRNTMTIDENSKFGVGLGSVKTAFKDKAGKASKDKSAHLIQNFSSKSVRGKQNIPMRNFLALDFLIDKLDDQFSKGIRIPVGSKEGAYYKAIWGEGENPIFNAEAARKLLHDKTLTQDQQQDFLFSLLLTDPTTDKLVQPNMYGPSRIMDGGDTSALIELPLDVAMNLSLDFDSAGTFKNDLTRYMKKGGFSFTVYEDTPLKLGTMRYADLVAELSKPEYKDNINAIMLLNELRALRKLSVDAKELKPIFSFYDTESLQLMGAGMHEGLSDQEIADRLNATPTKKTLPSKEVSHDRKYAQGKLANPNDDTQLTALDLKRAIDVTNYKDARPVVTAEEVAELRTFVKAYAESINTSLATTLVIENPEASLKTRFDLNGSDDKVLRLSKEDIYTLRTEELELLETMLPKKDFENLVALVDTFQKSSFAETAAYPWMTRLQEGSNKQTAKADMATGFDPGKDSVQAKEAEGRIARKLKRYMEDTLRIKASNYHNYEDFTSDLMERYYAFVDAATGGTFVHTGSIFLTNMDNKAAVQSMVEDVAYYQRSLKNLSDATSESGAKLSPEKVRELAMDIFVKTSGTEADAEPLRYTVIDKDGNIKYQAHYMKNHRDHELNDLYFNMLNNPWALGDTLLVHTPNSNHLEFVEMTPENRELIKNQVLSDMFKRAPAKEKEMLSRNAVGASYKQNKDAETAVADWFVNTLESHVSQQTLRSVAFKQFFDTAESNGTKLSEYARRRIERAFSSSFDDLQSGSHYSKRYQALMGLWEKEYGHLPDAYDRSQANPGIKRIIDILENGFARDTLLPQQQELLDAWKDANFMADMEDYVDTRDAAVNAKIQSNLDFYNLGTGVEVTVEGFRKYMQELHSELRKHASGMPDAQTMKDAKRLVNHKVGGGLSNKETRAYEATYATMLANNEFGDIYKGNAEDRAIHALDRFLHKRNYKGLRDSDFDKVPEDMLLEFLRSHIGRGTDMKEIQFMFNDREDTDATFDAFLDYEGFPKTENLKKALTTLRNEVRAAGATRELPEFTQDDKIAMVNMLNQLDEISQKRMIVADMNQIYRKASKHKRMLDLYDSHGIPSILNTASLFHEISGGLSPDDLATINAAASGMAGGAQWKQDPNGKFFTTDGKFVPLKVTGHRFAAILGLDPYNTEFSAFAEMTKSVKIDSEKNEYTEAGNYIEPKQIEWTKENVSNKVMSPEEYFQTPNAFDAKHGDFFQDKAIFGGMWDAVEVDENGKIVTLIEYKTVKDASKWAKGVPEHNKAQAMLYAHQLGVKKVKVIVTFPDEAGYKNPADFDVTAENTRVYDLDTDTNRLHTRGGDLRIDEAVYRVEQWYNKHVGGRKSPEFNPGNKRDAEILKQLKAVEAGGRVGLEAKEAKPQTALLIGKLETISTEGRTTADIAMAQAQQWLEFLADGDLAFGDSMQTAVERFKEALGLALNPQPVEPSTKEVGELSAKLRATFDKGIKGKPIAGWPEYLNAIQLNKDIPPGMTQPPTYADAIRNFYEQQLADPTSEAFQRYTAAENGDLAFRITDNMSKITEGVFRGLNIDKDLMAEFYQEGMTFYNENIQADHPFVPNEKKIKYTVNKLNQDLQKLELLKLGSSIEFRRLWDLVVEAVSGDVIKGLDGENYTLDSSTLAISKTKFHELFGMSYEAYQKKNPKAGSSFYAGVVRSPVDKADGAHAYRIVVMAGEENGAIRMTRDSLLSRHSGDLDGDHIAIIKPMMSSGEQGYFKELADMAQATYGVLDGLLAKGREAGIKVRDDAGRVIFRMYADDSAAGQKLFGLVDDLFDGLMNKTITYAEAVDHYKDYLAQWMADSNYSEKYIESIFNDEDALKRILQMTFIQEYATDGTVQNRTRIYGMNNRNVWFDQKRYRDENNYKTMLDMSRRYWLLHTDKETGTHQKHRVANRMQKITSEGERIAEQFGYVPIRFTDETKFIVDNLDAASIQSALASLTPEAQLLFKEFTEAGLNQGDAMEAALQKHENMMRRQTLSAEFFQRHTDAEAFGNNLRDFTEANDLARRYAGESNAWFGSATEDVGNYVREIIYSIAEQYGYKDQVGLQKRVGIGELVEQGRVMEGSMAFIDHDMNADAVFVRKSWAEKYPVYQVIPIPRKAMGDQWGSDTLTADLPFDGRVIPKDTKVLDTKEGYALLQIKIPISTSTKLAMLGTSAAKAPVILVDDNDYTYIPKGYDMATSKAAVNGAKMGDTYYGDKEYGPQPIFINKRKAKGDNIQAANVHMVITEDTAYYRTSGREANMDGLILSNSFNGLMPMAFWGGHFLKVDGDKVTIDPTFTKEAIDNAIKRPDFLPKNGISFARTGRAIVLAKHLLPDAEAKVFIERTLKSAYTANSQFEQYINKILQGAGLYGKSPQEIQDYMIKNYNLSSHEAAFLDPAVIRLGTSNKVVDIDAKDEEAFRFVSKSNPDMQLGKAELSVAPGRFESMGHAMDETISTAGGKKRLRSLSDGFASMSDVQRELQVAIARLEDKEYNGYNYNENLIREATRKGLLNVSRGSQGEYGDRFLPLSMDDVVEMPANYAFDAVKKNSKAGQNADNQNKIFNTVMGVAQDLDFIPYERSVSKNLVHHVGRDMGYDNNKYQGETKEWRNNLIVRDMLKLNRYGNKLDLLQHLEGYDGASVRPSRSKFFVDDAGKVSFREEVDALPLEGDSFTDVRQQVEDTFVSPPTIMKQRTDELRKAAIVSQVAEERQLLSIGSNLKMIVDDYKDRNFNKIEREGDFRKQILDLIAQGEVKKQLETSFSETLLELRKSGKDTGLPEEIRKTIEAEEKDVPDLEALKEETTKLIANPNVATGKNVEESKKISTKDFLSRSGIKVDSPLAAAIDSIINRAVDRDKRIGTMELLGEPFALMSARLSQLSGQTRYDFNRWVQASAMLKFQDPANLPKLMKQLDFPTVEAARQFVEGFQIAYPDLTGLHSLMVAQRVSDFNEYNKEYPNDATLLHLYVPHAQNPNDIFHLTHQAEGVRGGNANKMTAERFGSANVEIYTHYDFMTNMVRLAEHISAKKAYRKAGQRLIDDGFIDNASVRQSALQVFKERFKLMADEDKRLRGDYKKHTETLTAIAKLGDQYGLAFNRLLDPSNNRISMEHMLDEVQRLINKYPKEQRMGYYDLYDMRDNWTPEQRKLANLYEVELQLAHFALQNIPELRKDLTGEFMKLQQSGLVLVDNYGRRIDKLNDYQGTAVSAIDAEPLKRAAYMGMDPLSAILTGDVGLMDAKLADYLYKTVYHVKEKSVFNQLMSRIMSNTVRAIMSNPTKILSRLTTYTQSDVGLFAMSDVRAVTKLPEARREISAYLQSHGMSHNDDLLLFFEVMGIAPSAEKGVGLDPIRFEERRAQRVKYASTYYDKVAELFESQTLITRYALWKQMNQNFLNEGNMGNVYHRREALKYYDNTMDRRTAAAYKAGYVVDNTMGAPGGFPIAARQLGQWMTFTTYPLALTRGTTESVLSILAAGKDALAGDKVAQKSLAIPVGGSLGLAIVTSAINALLVESLGGQPNEDDDDKEDGYNPFNYMKDAILKGQALDIPSTLWNREALFNSSALMSPYMSMYEMFVEPWTQTYPDGTPVELDEKFWDAADTLVIGKLHPLIKLALETVSGKDSTGFGMVDRDPMLTPPEHILRKIIGYQMGAKAADTMFKQAYAERLQDEDMGWMESVVRGFGTALTEEVMNSKQFKHDRHNHTEALKMVNAWKYNFEEQLITTANEQREIFGDNMLLFSEDYMSITDSEYNQADAKYMTKILQNLMKNSESPMTVYEQIARWDEDGEFSKASMRAALNRVSIVRKLNSLKDPEEFFNSLDQKERAMIEQAILYEREMYPSMEKYFPDTNKGYDPYIPKDYTRFVGDGKGTTSSYSSGGRTYLPRSWNYYRKIKPRYRPNYTQNLYNKYQKKRKPLGLMEVGDKFFVNPMTETTNNRKAKVDNTSTNFKAQRVYETRQSAIQNARKYAKQRGK